MQTRHASFHTPHGPMTLCGARCGVRLRVLGVASQSSSGQRLRELGFHEEREVRKIADGSPLICRMGEARLAITRRLGADVLVEEVHG